VRWLKRPDVWFLLAVLALAAGGAALVNNRTCRNLDEREWRWFTAMNGWQAAFDSLSAACGVGLLTSNLDEEYTVTGKWLLTGLGVAGAGLYLAAGTLALRRLRVACGESAPSPPIWAILAAFAILLVLSLGVVGALERLSVGSEGAAPAGGWNGSAWRAIAAAASLGWLPERPPPTWLWVYALVALVAGLGWTVWLLPVPAVRRRNLRVARTGLAVAGYVATLVLAATLLFILEAPRDQRDSPPNPRTLTGQPAGTRYTRCLVQVACGATAGMPTEALSNDNVTEGTKVALAMVLIVGPLGAATGGGITWTLLIWALGGGIATFAGRGRPTHPASFRLFLAGLGGLVLVVGLVLIVAFGLLVIESHTASLYQSAPTFADAFLDAASAVAGGNLTTGVVETVTARKLSRGIRQPVDLYQYGMVWLMAAMVLGRVLPLFVMCQAACTKLNAAPARTGPNVSQA